MWVPGSIAFLVPAVILGMRALEPDAAALFDRFRVSGFRAFHQDCPGISCGRLFSDRFSGIATFGAAFKQRCCCWPLPSQSMGSSGHRSHR